MQSYCWSVSVGGGGPGLDSRFVADRSTNSRACAGPKTSRLLSYASSWMRKRQPLPCGRAPSIRVCESEGRRSGGRGDGRLHHVPLTQARAIASPQRRGAPWQHWIVHVGRIVRCTTVRTLLSKRATGGPGDAIATPRATSGLSTGRLVTMPCRDRPPSPGRQGRNDGRAGRYACSQTDPLRIPGRAGRGTAMREAQEMQRLAPRPLWGKVLWALGHGPCPPARGEASRVSDNLATWLAGQVGHEGAGGGAAAHAAWRVVKRLQRRVQPSPGRPGRLLAPSKQAVQLRLIDGLRRGGGGRTPLCCKGTRPSVSESSVTPR